MGGRIGGILIIDDQDMVRAGIRKMLKELKLEIFPVSEASDGNAALNIVKKNEPDIILVDIMMPGMDGLELINILRRQSINSRIIVISAYSDFNYAQKAIQHRVESYLLKPVSKKDLYQVVMSEKKTYVRKTKGRRMSRSSSIITCFSVNSTDISDALETILNYFMYNLARRDKYVSIEDELRNILDYIEIHNMIRSRKIEYNVRIAGDINGKLSEYGILKFTLQSLVENSIKHAFKNMTAGCQLPAVYRYFVCR